MEPNGFAIQVEAIEPPCKKGKKALHLIFNVEKKTAIWGKCASEQIPNVKC